jgi:muramidase (phage lysozyme)
LEIIMDPTVPRGAALSRADKYHVYRPLLDLIGFTEGTDKGRGYDETLAYGAYTNGPVNLVKLTLASLDTLQTRMLQHPKNKWKSSACGRYQIVRTTARAIKESLPGRYPDNRLFDEACQDEMACYLLGIRGIDKYLAGRLSEHSLINNLAKEWASLPTTAGKGHYGGQHAAVSVARVRSVLAEVRQRHKQGQPANVPVKVEQEVAKQADRTGWSLFGGGGVFAGLSAMLGANWQTILAIGALGLIGFVLIMIFKRKIIETINDVRSAVKEA